LIGFCPTPQLSVDLERIDIHMTNRTCAPSTAEFEGSDTLTMDPTDQARFLHRLARGDFVGVESPNWIAFWNDPSATAS
jgi:hypothetical protein